MTTDLDPLFDKLVAGVTISDADLRTLADTRDIVALGMAADEARRRRHGARTTFVRVWEVPAAAAVGGAAPPREASELRVVGPLADLPQAVAAVRGAASSAGRAAVTGFSLAELEHVAQAAGVTLAGALADLREAGLTMVAHAPVDRLWGGEASLAAAAAAGVPVAALTLFERGGDDVLALIGRIAALRPSVHGVRAVAPLARMPGPEPTTGYEDVRLVALVRLLLDVEHVQVDWTVHGPKLAQVALTFGADDVDRVSPAGELSEGPRRAPLEEIRRNIRAAGQEPVERDGRFQPIA